MSARRAAEATDRERQRLDPTRAELHGHTLHLADGTRLRVDGPRWEAAVGALHAITLRHPEGDVLIVRERRRRGASYWVARAYDRGRRASSYIGRALDAAAIARAVSDLRAKIAAKPAKPAGRGRKATPDQLREALAELGAAETDPAKRRLLDEIGAMVDAAWSQGSAKRAS